MTDQDVPVSKEVKFQIRLDEQLAERAKRKAVRVGGLAPVVRALLRRWLEEDIVSPEQIARELPRAPQKARKAPTPRRMSARPK